MNEKTKTIKFNMDKQEDRELWEWMQKLPHGSFSTLTKEYWINKMNEKDLATKKYYNQNNIDLLSRQLNYNKEFHEAVDKMIDNMKEATVKRLK